MLDRKPFDFSEKANTHNSRKYFCYSDGSSASSSYANLKNNRSTCEISQTCLQYPDKCRADILSFRQKITQRSCNKEKEKRSNKDLVTKLKLEDRPHYQTLPPQQRPAFILSETTFKPCSWDFQYGELGPGKPVACSFFLDLWCFQK